MADVGKVVRGLDKSFDEMMAVLSGLKDNVDISVPVSDSSSGKGITPVQDIAEIVEDNVQERLSKIDDFMTNVSECVRTLVIPYINYSADKIRERQKENAKGMLMKIKQDISGMWAEADKEVFVNYVKLHFSENNSSKQSVYSAAEGMDRRLVDLVESIILSITGEQIFEVVSTYPEEPVENVLSSLKASCIDWSDIMDERDSNLILNELELGLLSIVQSIIKKLNAIQLK